MYSEEFSFLIEILLRQIECNAIYFRQGFSAEQIGRWVAERADVNVSLHNFG